MNRNKVVQEATITIKGMHCKSCVDLIESEISSLEGVESIKVDLIETNARVRFNPGKVSLEKIKSEITSLGYSTDNSSAKKNSLLQGLTYGVIPHIGCIAFIGASIVGATAAMNLFKPLLMNPYFFHILVVISLIFATVSSIIYLRRNNVLSLPGIKRKWKYLSTMYGSTVGANLLFFMVVFPLLANVSSAAVTGAFTSGDDVSFVMLQVDIPCPGHAPLISEELKSIDGILEIRFNYPNIFAVTYDSTQTDKEEMLSLEVFNVYRATIIEEPLSQPDQQVDNQSTGGCCGSSGYDGRRRGGCGCGTTG